MSTLLLVILIFSIWHFVYEGIILPSLRLKLRFKLFVLRDRMRELKTIHGNKFSDEVYYELQDSVNTTIRVLHRINIVTVFNASRAFEENEGLRLIVSKRNELIKSCPIAEVRDISDQNSLIIREVLFANFGSWMVYIVPAVLVIVFFNKCLEFTRQFTLLPGDEVERFLPSKSFA